MSAHLVILDNNEIKNMISISDFLDNLSPIITIDAHKTNLITSLGNIRFSITKMYMEDIDVLAIEWAADGHKFKSIVNVSTTEVTES